MTPLQLTLVVCIGLAMGLVAWAVWSMNSLTALRAAIREAWQECELTLGRRHEQVGLLVDALESQGYENCPAVEAVVGARSQAMVDTRNYANYLSRERVLSSTVNALLELVDRDPRVRYNLVVATKLHELAAVESRLGADERIYNARVHEYNRACEAFPTTLIAALGQLKPVPLMKLPQIERPKSMEAYAPGDTRAFA